MARWSIPSSLIKSPHKGGVWFIPHDRAGRAFCSAAGGEPSVEDGNWGYLKILPEKERGIGARSYPPSNHRTPRAHTRERLSGRFSSLLAALKSYSPSRTPHEVVLKPWGFERPVGEFGGLYLKELYLLSGKRTSYHRHQEKHEVFYLVEGDVMVRLEGKERHTTLTAGESLYIPAGQAHRILAAQDSLILEIGTQMFGDVERLEDDYPRARRD